MKYLSVCSGIEAATVAWHPLNWQPVGFSEIEKFPSRVLAHHYPDIANLGDMNAFQKWPDTDVDLLVGGTPCQSFSLAGLRAGMADPRGNLALVYLAIAARYCPRWLVWENVPGVLSSEGGRDFSSIIGAMVELGYGVAWRVLDAQYFGVPQRRRRVFVVGYLGDWRTAVEVLFEQESLYRNAPPSRETQQDLAAGIGSGTEIDSKDGLIPEICSTMGTDVGGASSNHNLNKMIVEKNNLVFSPDITCTLSVDTNQWIDQAVIEQFPMAKVYGTLDATETDKGCNNQWINQNKAIICPPAKRMSDKPEQTAFDWDAEISQQPIIAVASKPESLLAFTYNRWDGDESENLSPPLRASTGIAVSFSEGTDAEIRLSPVVGPLMTGGGRPGMGYPALLNNLRVRRLMPIECERLQGFPDNYTNVPYRGRSRSPDGLRYKALGNSMAVPCMFWIGKRIANVENNRRSAKSKA